MIIIVCIDDRKGLMFHNRRVSQDRFQRQDMLRECGGKNLYMSEYSEKMFCDNEARNIVVSGDFLKRAGAGEYCFVEDADVSEYEEKMEAVILYRWNRSYPADVYFTLNLSEDKWILERTEEFKGSSHDRITKEVYKRAE